MMRKYFLCIGLVVSLFLGKAQSVNIPNGVNYGYCSEETNSLAVSKIKKELSNKCTYEFFKTVLTIGPQLWTVLKNVPELNKIEGGNVEFQLPVRNEKGKVVQLQILKGKIIQTKDDFGVFWDYVRKNLIQTTFTIRKLNANELNYYWSVIFFDIKEPVFIIESGNTKLLFDLEPKEGGALNLLWIDKV